MIAHVLVIVNIARTISANAIVGNVAYDPATVVHMYEYDLSRMKSIFGPPKRTMLETTVDIIKDFEMKGWIESSAPAERKDSDISPFKLD